MAAVDDTMYILVTNMSVHSNLLLSHFKQRFCQLIEDTASQHDFERLCFNARLAEEEILKHITTTDSSVLREAALEMLRSWYSSHPVSGRMQINRSSSPSPNPGAPGSSQAEGLELGIGRCVSTNL